MIERMNTIAEKWRPSVWGEVIGHERVVARLQSLAERDALGGKAYWIHGQSGTGKTTIARLLALEFADAPAVKYLEARAIRPGLLGEIELEWEGASLGEKPGRAYVIDEAHLIRSDVWKVLVPLLDATPDTVIWCFTTVEAPSKLFNGKPFAAPLLSRCTLLELSAYGLALPFAQRAKLIAAKEGLDGRPLEAYIRLAQSKRNNLRAMLASIEAGELAA